MWLNFDDDTDVRVHKTWIIIHDTSGHAAMWCWCGHVWFHISGFSLLVVVAQSSGVFFFSLLTLNDCFSTLHHFSRKKRKCSQAEVFVNHLIHSMNNRFGIRNNQSCVCRLFWGCYLLFWGCWRGCRMQGQPREIQHTLKNYCRAPEAQLWMRHHEGAVSSRSTCSLDSGTEPVLVLLLSVIAENNTKQTNKEKKPSAAIFQQHQWLKTPTSEFIILSK